MKWLNLIWERHTDGSAVSHHTSKESSPEWYAIVYMYDGRWIYRIGERKQDGHSYHLSDKRKGWKTLSVAKSRAERAIITARDELAKINEKQP